MHSSRMRTVRCSDRRGGRGMSTPMHAGICVPRGCLPQCMLGYGCLPQCMLGYFCPVGCLPQCMLESVADPGGAEGAMAPHSSVQISHKKMAAKGGHIDFMFLGPPTRPLDQMLGIHPPPREQNDSQTGVKTLPCRNYIADGNKQEACQTCTS